MKLAIFGATGDTGKYLVEMAIERGHGVTAIERHFPDKWKSRDDISRYEADILEDDLVQAIEGQDAVLSTLGVAATPSSLAKPPPLYTKGSKRILGAMNKAKVNRLVTISAAFVDPNVNVPSWFQSTTMAAMHNIFDEMSQMENIIQSTAGIEWTLVRPGWLLDLPFSDNYQVSLENLPDNTLRTRHADVAAFMLKCTENKLHLFEKPNIARKEDYKYENPIALTPDILATLGL